MNKNIACVTGFSCVFLRMGSEILSNGNSLLKVDRKAEKLELTSTWILLLIFICIWSPSLSLCLYPPPLLRKNTFLKRQQMSVMAVHLTIFEGKVTWSKHGCACCTCQQLLEELHLFLDSFQKKNHLI